LLLFFQAGGLPMTLVEFVVYLIIAGICGAIARALVGGSGGGFVISILVGFLGAFVGSWLAYQLHLPVILAVTIDRHRFPIVWSILGGIVLVGVAHMLMGRRYTGRYVR
jgi:uncharacterized membrane protein YeaQ/YmgE (transglycosylase-associated protein family)